MDTINSRPIGQAGEPAQDTGDWRATLKPVNRQRAVNRIVDTLKRLFPGEEALEQVKEMAVRFEEKTYTVATSQSDYIRKIAVKMINIESKYHHKMSDSVPQNPAGNSNRPTDPGASLDSTAQDVHANGGDWQEEAYQKIKAMKEKYLPELTEMYQKVAAKVQQHDSLPQPPKTDQLDKLKIIKSKLEGIISFLQVSKDNVSLGFKDKLLESYEKQIVDFINTNKLGKLMTSEQQTQLSQPHIHQPKSQVSQVQSHENQMNAQLQSTNLQGSGPTMQQNIMSSLQKTSVSSLSGISTSQMSSQHLPEQQLQQQAKQQLPAQMEAQQIHQVQQMNDVNEVELRLVMGVNPGFSPQYLSAYAVISENAQPTNYETQLKNSKFGTKNPKFDIEAPEITPTLNVSSAVDCVFLYIRNHFDIFAIPSTLCFMGAMSAFVNTLSFTSLVERVGEGNTTLILAAIAMLWFPFLYYSRKLRGADKNSFHVKLGVGAAFFFTDASLFLLYHTHGYALLVFLLMGCAINAADFAGVGGRVSYECKPTILLGIMVATLHWGFTCMGLLVLALLYVYMLFRIWVYVK